MTYSAAGIYLVKIVVKMKKQAKVDSSFEN